MVPYQFSRVILCIITEYIFQLCGKMPYFFIPLKLEITLFEDRELYFDD